MKLATVAPPTTMCGILAMLMSTRDFNIFFAATKFDESSY